ERLVDLDEVHVIEAEPGLLERLAARGRGADAHDRRIHARNAPRDEAADGLQAVRRRPVRVRDHDRRGAIADAAGVAGGHQTIRLEVGLERSESLARGVRPHVLIRPELHLALAGADGDGRDLGIEAAFVPRLLRAHLRAVVDVVGLLARDAVAARELFRRLRHGEAALRVGERGPQRVLEHPAGLTQPQLAPARAAHDVRRLAHGLRAAGQDDVRLAEQDLLRAADDG